MAFYRPDKNSQTVYTAEGKPIDYNTYKSMGGTGVAGQGEFADVQYAPLPTLTPRGPAAVAPQQQPQQDPVGKFNMGIYELLKKAQSMDPTALYNERNRLALQQTTDSMAPADASMQGLTPGAALSARGRTADLYNPEINNLTDRIKASSQAVSQFEGAIKAAKEYGEEYAKSIKPDQQTINAVQEMLNAGENPGKEVLDSVYKYIDWGKVGAAKKTEKSKRTQIVSLNGREVLVDMDTGEPIKDLGKVTYKPTGDGKPKAPGAVSAGERSRYKVPSGINEDQFNEVRDLILQVKGDVGGDTSYDEAWGNAVEVLRGNGYNVSNGNWIDALLWENLNPAGYDGWAKEKGYKSTPAESGDDYSYLDQ